MQITAAKRKTDRIVRKMQQAVGAEMALSIVLSSLTREARRQHGLDGARTLLQGLVGSMPEGEQGEVYVPSAAFQLGPRERAVWIAAGVMVRTLREEFDEVIACKMILVSVGATRPMVQGLLDTMAEAAQPDL